MAALQKALMLEDIELHGYGDMGIYRGIKWEIKRSDYTYLCGYVVLPDSDSKLLDYLEQFTHGGWTFANDTAGLYGFDCAHAGDFRGGFFHMEGDVYRDWDYVFDCIKKIIDAYHERRPEIISN